MCVQAWNVACVRWLCRDNKVPQVSWWLQQTVGPPLCSSAVVQEAREGVVYYMWLVRKCFFNQPCTVSVRLLSLFFFVHLGVFFFVGVAAVQYVCL